MCSCPFVGDCPMVDFVSEGAIRVAMQRLLCSHDFSDCVWLKLKGHEVTSRVEELQIRMKKVLMQLNAAA